MKKHAKNLSFVLILIAIVLLTTACASSSDSNGNNNYTNYIKVSNERITREFIGGYYTPYYSAKVYNKSDKTIRVALKLNRYIDGFYQDNVLGGEITFLPKETNTFGRNLPYAGTYVAEWTVVVID